MPLSQDPSCPRAAEDGRGAVGAELSLLQAVRRHVSLTVCTIVVCTAVAGGIALLGGGGYQATATVIFTPEAMASIGSGGLSAPDASRHVSTLALLAESDEVVAAAVASDDGAGNVEATPDPDADALQLMYTASPASAAIDGANAVADELLRRLVAAQAARLDARLSGIEGALRDPVVDAVDEPAATAARAALLEERATLTAALATLERESSAWIRPATTADPSGYTLPQLLVLGFVIGGVAGATAAWFRASADDRRGDAGVRARAGLGAPLLRRLDEASITTVVPSNGHASSIDTGGLRLAAAGLVTRARAVGADVIAVVAPANDETTGATVGIGRAAMQNGLRVLLVDGDPSGRRLSRTIRPGGPSPSSPTVDVRGASAPISGAARIAVAGGGYLDLLSGGGSAPLTAAFGDAAGGGVPYDLVLVDAAGLARGADAVALVMAAGAALVVLRRLDDPEDIEELTEHLAITSTPVVGYLEVGAVRSRRPRRARRPGPGGRDVPTIDARPEGDVVPSRT